MLIAQGDLVDLHEVDQDPCFVLTSESDFWQGNSEFCFSFAHLKNGDVLTYSMKVPNVKALIILCKDWFTQGNIFFRPKCMYL